MMFFDNNLRKLVCHGTQQKLNSQESYKSHLARLVVIASYIKASELLLTSII